MVGKYLANFLPFSARPTGFYLITEETDKYWVSKRADYKIYVNKKTLYERGSDKKYEIWDSTRVQIFVTHHKLLKKVNKIDFEKLDCFSLNKNLEIAQAAGQEVL